jgi:hypothetical protein
MMWKRSEAASRSRSSSVAISGVGSTTTIGILRTSVRTANPKSSTCTRGSRSRMASVCRSRSRWRVSLRTNPRNAFMPPPPAG